MFTKVGYLLTDGGWLFTRGRDVHIAVAAREVIHNENELFTKAAILLTKQFVRDRLNAFFPGRG